MRTIEVKISGSGTIDSVAVSLIAIGRQLQIANVYGGEIPAAVEDGTVIIEITEDYNRL
jgi:hypothetical protein